MRTKTHFPSIGERLRAALVSYQKGIGVEYELKATRARGHTAFPILDELGFELLDLIENNGRLNELEHLITQLRDARIRKHLKQPDSPVQ